MPYGLPKNVDTPKNNAWMESCVESVMKTGKAKPNAIAICKVTLQRKGKKGKSEEEEFSEQSLRDVEEKLHKALRELFAPDETVGPERVSAYLVDAYDTFVIAEIQNHLYRLDYTISDDGEVRFSNPIKVERKVTYEPTKEESSIKVPQMDRSQYRRITYGPRTI